MADRGYWQFIQVANHNSQMGYGTSTIYRFNQDTGETFKLNSVGKWEFVPSMEQCASCGK